MLRLLLTVLIISIPINSIAGEHINAPADDVYQKAVEVAMDMSTWPEKINDNLHYFKTEPTRIKLSEKECDCGKRMGIPYLEDKRTMIEVTYQIRVKQVGEGSELDVRTSVIGYYDQHINKTTKVLSQKERDEAMILDCKCSGLIEKKFIDSVRSSF
jgi:hypothetical protein